MEAEAPIDLFALQESNTVDAETENEGKGHCFEFVRDFCAWLKEMGTEREVWKNTTLKKYKSDALEYGGFVRLRCIENRRSARCYALILLKFRKDCSGWDILGMEPRIGHGSSQELQRDRTGREIEAFVADISDFTEHYLVCG